MLAPDVCWVRNQVACETFCLDDDDTILEATLALRSPTLSSSTVRFVEAKQENLAKGILARCVINKINHLGVVDGRLNITTGVREILCEDVIWIQVAQNMII